MCVRACARDTRIDDSLRIQLSVCACCVCWLSTTIKIGFQQNRKLIDHRSLVQWTSVCLWVSGVSYIDIYVDFNNDLLLLCFSPALRSGFLIFRYTCDSLYFTLKQNNNKNVMGFLRTNKKRNWCSRVEHFDIIDFGWEGKNCIDSNVNFSRKHQNNREKNNASFDLKFL